MCYLKSAYSITCSSLFGISSWILLTSHILRINNLVHATEPTLRLREKDLHILERTSSDQDTSISVNRPTFRLYRNYINHESAIFVLF